MISFIVYVFWLLVFLASVFFLAVSLWDNSEENEDSQSFEKKKIIYGLTSIGHLNSWQTMGASLGCFLAALLSAWFIDIFYLFLWISLFAVGFGVFGILSALGSDEEDFSSSIMRNLKEFNLDKALTYLPTYALVTSFVLIFAINGAGMAEWDDASTSKSSVSSSNSSGSSSKATSSEIANIAKREYVSESKVKEWIDLIGFDELKSMRTSRSFECMDANSNYCLAQGKLDDAVRKKAGEQGCKKDWRKCSSAMEWARADDPYNMSGAKSACYDAINQSQGENVLRAYGRNALGRYDKKIKNGNIILHSTDFKYSCSYNIETKKAKSI